MGLGDAPVVTNLTDTVLARAKVPVVIDADALNELARGGEIRARLAACKAPLILTPHLGEAARLLSCNIPQIAADPISFAAQTSRALAAITVLKDARTVITDGVHLSLNAKGNSGMATGGSGDVLAGVIAAFLAAGTSPFGAAELGVLVHAMAGDAAAKSHGSHGLMASDIIDGLSHVLS
jgi:NAD(P)H-hydrate epimerase